MNNRAFILKEDKAEEFLSKRKQNLKCARGKRMTKEEINKRIMQACKNMWNEKVCKEIEEYLEQEPIKIRDEIETQEKWLAQAGYNAYNVDIAFKSIKLVLAETEK